MYSALAQYRNQWVSIITNETGATRFDGPLEEVTPEYVRIKAYYEDGERKTHYINLQSVIRFSIDASDMRRDQLQAAYCLGDDDDGKELAHA